MNQQKKFAEEWVAYITAQMARSLIKSGRSVTKETLRSIAYDVSESGVGMIDIDILFKDSGRYMEMRTQMGNQIGQKVFENLEDWVRRKGIGAFEYVPGYRKGVMGISQEKNIQRIALGIMFSRSANVNSQRAVTANKTKNKRKTWWSDVVYGGLGDLYGRIIYQMEEDILKGFKNGMGDN